jgi:hypothetical protein
MYTMERLLNNRQKIIKFADSSDLGWRVVQEYEANPLADDSDDVNNFMPNLLLNVGVHF